MTKSGGTNVSHVNEVDAGVQSRTYTFKQLGSISSMTLRGADGRDSVPFNVRGADSRDTVPFNVRMDEVISSAYVKLSYAFSPALLDDASQINLLINGDVAGSIPLVHEKGGQNNEWTVQIPPRLITDYNQLTLQLTGRTYLQCGDPSSTALWANVSNRSELVLTTQKIIIPNDLALLPVPFMDPRDPKLLELPFVFFGATSNTYLEAAGTVSSWFGALAGSRGARFPVELNSIPSSGNAIVMLQGQPNIPGVALPEITGATLSVITNPNDRYGKLLFVMGRDAVELKRAAQALTLGTKTLAGQTALIASLATLSARKPYDAPNWITDTRAVTFGELATPRTLNVTGYDPGPIRINIHVPPDLYSESDVGVPVKLSYRYTPQPTSKNSSLTVAINNELLKSFPLFPIQILANDKNWLGQLRAMFRDESSLLDKLQADETLPLKGQVHIPLPMLYPRSQLQLRYMFDYVKSGECDEIIIDNVRGAISSDSTLDISGFSHFISMPDLRAFHTSGYPFTRLADLSETAVILPELPSLQEYASYLEVLGLLGDSSGYPATEISVIRGTLVDAFADKDLLLIASGDDQPLLKQWATALPANLGGGAKFKVSDLLYKARNFLSPDSQDNVKNARSTISFSNVTQGGLIAGFESPLKNGRSAVLIWGAQAQGLNESLHALIGGDINERSIEGSLVRIRSTQVDPLVAEQTYQVGNLGFFGQAKWLLSRNILLFLLCASITVLLIAIVAYVFLRMLAGRRLRVSEGGSIKDES